MNKSIRQFFYILFHRKEIHAMLVLRYGPPRGEYEWLATLPDAVIVKVYERYTEGRPRLQDPMEIRIFFHIILTEDFAFMFVRKHKIIMKYIMEELILHELNI